MNITIHIDRVVIPQPADPRIDELLNLVKTLEGFMSQTQELIDQLSAAVTENTSAVESAVTQINGLISHVNELLQAAADAPTLEETNALIAKAQEAVSIIHANSDALIQAQLANTVAA
jgi:hypothetical protein